MTQLPLFAFGTLRDVQVLHLVLGRDPRDVVAREAWLEGHRTVVLPGETFPVLAPCAGARVGGLLLELTAADLARVAFFEGDEYGFDRATVVTAGDARETAILCGERGSRAGHRPAWSLEQWQRDHKAGFLPMVGSYMAYYGSMSVTEADRIWRELTGQP